MRPLHPVAAPRPLRRLVSPLALLLLTLLLWAAGAAAPARAAEPSQQAIEQVMASAQQDKRGVTLFVHGQTISGAVVRLEPGQWVELRSVQLGRIVVRMDRIDGIAAP
ncbi:MAG: hypothetical protein ABI574_08310 [Burkholderiales bacterium]